MFYLYIYLYRAKVQNFIARSEKSYWRVPFDLQVKLWNLYYLRNINFQNNMLWKCINGAISQGQLALFFSYDRHGPRREKTVFLHMRKQRRRSAKLISAFVFATRIVQSLFFLNTNFQASSHLLWLHSLVCVRPGQKPRRPVFSQRGSYTIMKSKTEKYNVRHV